jgi:hypothetical protein
MKNLVGIALGLALFYLLSAFITGDWLWPSLMFNGIGIDLMDRTIAFIFASIFSYLGQQIAEFYYT